MTPARWQQVEDVYHVVAALPAADRAGAMAGLCRDDQELRREVESLLAHAGAASVFLETPAMADSSVSVPADLEERTLVGRQFGPYRIVSALGAGGMGEVYRAHDQQLERDVAIKLLPRLFSSDPTRRARFEREARTLAALNHPHIGAIYGHQDVDGDPALVLELVEGETLAVRLARAHHRPVLLKEGLAIARSIAEALEAAHERGVIHRDLKPANIMITPDGVVKVLDFGLAKFKPGAATESGESNGEAVNVSHAPTPSLHETRDGTILGTVQYMSPEQALGKAADKRSDLWAFGVIVLEMLTGRPVFAGTTDREVIAAIADLEPDWALLPSNTPTALRTLLRRCVEKDRTRRLDSAAAARLEIEDVIAVPAGTPQVHHAAPRRKNPAIALSGLGAGVVVGALVAYGVWRAPVAPMAPSRFAITSSSARPLNLSWDDRDITITPDGRHFAYLGGGGLRAGAAVMVRAADRLDAYQVNPGTLGLFPSFDSRWLGLFANGELQKVSVDGGAAITLARIKGGVRGASWGDDDSIVFATDDPATGLMRVSANGGDPQVLTTPDPAQPDTDHAFPSVLPGGRGILFTITTKGQPGSGQVAVLDVSTGERKTLVRGATQAQYVDPSAGDGQIGYLLYAASGALRAVRFDLARLAVVGDPVTVVEGVMTKPTGAANYAVSRQGTLFYVTSGVAAQIAPTLLVWVDRSGREQPLDVPPRSYGPPRISPDGTQVAFNLIDQDGADIWVLDLARHTTRRLTFEPGVDGIPIWTPDGRRIIHSSDRTGVYNVYALSSDGSGGEARLTTSANAQYPTSIAPDGTVVGFEGVPIPVPPGISFRVRVFPDTRAGAADQSLFDGAWPEFSPDGRFLAYESNESGRQEVYVRPFPQVDSGRWQVSLAGGTRPVWSRNGREIFFLDLSNTMTSVAVRASGATFSAGQPAKVFDTKYVSHFPPRQYDVSSDGQRFLMRKDAGTTAAPASMVVVEHWFEELKARLR